MTLTAKSLENRWAEETTYGTSPSSVLRRFGWNEEVNIDMNVGETPVMKLGERTIGDFSYNVNRASINANFVLCTPWVYGMIFDGKTTGPNNSTYTQTYTKGTKGKSFTLNRNIKASDTGGTDYLLQLKGCTAQSLSISTSTGEMVRCSINAECGNYVKGTYDYDESTDDPDFSAANLSDAFPMTFAFGSISLGGNAIAEVDSVEFNIASTQPPIYEVGSVNAVSTVGGELRYSGRLSASLLSSARLDNLISRNTVGNLRLYFDNDKTGADLRSHAITFEDVSFGSLSNNASGVNVLKDDVTFTAKECSIQALTKASSVLK